MNVAKSCDSIISISSQKVNVEFPIRVNVNDIVALEVAADSTQFTQVEKNISFTVNAVRKDDTRTDVTNDVDVFAPQSITISKANRKFSLANDIENGDYEVVFRLNEFSTSLKISVNIKKVKSFDFYIYRWQETAEDRRKSLMIEPIAATHSSMEDKNSNWLRCLGILTYDDNTTEEVALTDADIRCSFGVVQTSNDSGVLHLEVNRLEGRTYEAQIAVIARFNGIDSTCYVNVVKDQMYKLIVKEASQDLSTLEVIQNQTNSYSLSISGEYKSGRIVDLSDNVNASMKVESNKNGDAIYNRNTLTISGIKYSRPLIVNATYSTNDDFVEDSRCFYVQGFGFIETVISGATTMQSNETNYYVPIAYYDNGSSAIVSSNFSLTDTTNGLMNEHIKAITYQVQSDKKGLSITAKKTLTNKNILISSFYGEPGYETVEYSTPQLNVQISGGFSLALSGSLITAVDGNSVDRVDIPFTSSSEFIESIEPEDFKQPIEFTINDRAGAVVDSEFISNISTTASTYHLLQITSDNGYNKTILADGLNAEPETIPDNNTYYLKFFDLLDSVECQNNVYPKNDVVVSAQFSQNTVKRIGDISPTNEHSFKYALIYRGNSSEPIEKRMNDEYTFAKNTRYDVHFIPINKMNSAINAYKEFTIDKRFDGSYTIGILNEDLGEDIQILAMIAQFETNTGFRYKKRLIPELIDGKYVWLVRGLPYRAVKLVSILVAFAFAEEDYWEI